MVIESAPGDQVVRQETHNQEVVSSNSGTLFTLSGVKTSLPFRLKREKIIENEAGVGHFSKRLKNWRWVEQTKIVNSNKWIGEER